MGGVDIGEDNQLAVPKKVRKKRRQKPEERESRQSEISDDFEIEVDNPIYTVLIFGSIFVLFVCITYFALGEAPAKPAPLLVKPPPKADVGAAAKTAPADAKGKKTDKKEGKKGKKKEKKESEETSETLTGLSPMMQN